VSTHSYIAIEGAIGAGKTTLARILGEALGAEVLLEVFEENPFLSDFYADRSRYAFQTQIFFLLSRYRQQHQVIAGTLRRTGLVSDYLFAKDWLFAHLNLAGDELTMYERVHAILGQHIPTPNLVVYLKASTETLMQRISFRDRPYERQMARDYIDSLRVAYEGFFGLYRSAPLLALDTDHVDFVRDDAVRAEFVGRIRSALRANGDQPALIALEPASETPSPGASGRRLSDLQRAHSHATARQPGQLDPFLDYLRLSSHVGALGRDLTEAWLRQEQILPQVGNRQEARDRAVESVSATLADDLGAALADLLSLANASGVDLEEAYLRSQTEAAR
jgi:deoxyadenosine/deoxycytidine kinase